MLSKKDKSESMSDTVFVRDTLREVYSIERFGSIKAAQTEAFDFLRKKIREKPLKMRRVRAFFEGQAKVIRGEEKDAVRAAQIEEARREYQSIKAKLARMEAALAVADAEFFGPQMDAYRSATTPLGQLDCTGTGSNTVGE